MRVIIPAAGEGARWGDGTPKQYATVADERIIDRLVRQASRHTTDIVTVGLPAKGATVARPRLNPTLGDIDKVASSRHLWSTSGRTVVLFGDVVLTDSAANMILTDTDTGWKVYGRHGPSPLGKPYGELFALSVWPHDHQELDRLIAVTAARHPEPNRLWHLYRAGVGLPVGRAVAPTVRFGHILDWSDDVDTPDEWETIRATADRQVTVVVPFDNSAGRRTAWRFVRRWYETHHPSWRVVLATDDSPEFSKPAAVNRRVQNLRADVLVVADADLVVPPHQLENAVALLQQHKWVVPQDMIHRITREATRQVIGERLPMGQAETERRYAAVAGGGLFVIGKDDFLRVGGFDERFGMWGAEDQAFQVAADTLLGRHGQVKGPLFHLWHPPMERVGTLRWKDNVRLLKRYRERLNNPKAIAELLDLDGDWEEGAGVRFRNVKTGEVVVVEDGSKAALHLSRRQVWQPDGRTTVEPRKATVPAARPPIAGAGSGRDAWQRYAESVGLNVTGLSRNVIVEMVDAHTV